MREGKRSYRPGHRQPDLTNNKTKKMNDGLMSKNRWAWVRVIFGQFVVLVQEETDEIEHTISIYHPTKTGRAISWNLTSLTEEELLKLKELFNAAFDWALPVVRQRDKEAADAFAKGDDSYARSYRQAPQLVFRKRPEREYGEGVQQRSQGVLEGDRGDVDPDGRVRGSGDGVAEHDSSEGSSENNWPTPHVPPKLC